MTKSDTPFGGGRKEGGRPPPGLKPDAVADAVKRAETTAMLQRRAEAMAVRARLERVERNRVARLDARNDDPPPEYDYPEQDTEEAGAQVIALDRDNAARRRELGR